MTIMMHQIESIFKEMEDILKKKTKWKFSS